MTRVINIGSLNVDRVLRVPGIARPGQTIAARSAAIHAGGKGANQSVALARAGASVLHVGKVGHDGRWLVELLASSGVDTSAIAVDQQQQTGQAVIQVDDAGHNCIVIDGGTNVLLSGEQIDRAIARCAAGDVLLLQNETNHVADAIRAGHAAGLSVVLNPAPMTDAVHSFPLELLSTLIVNEDEGEALSGQSEPRRIVTELQARCGAEVVLTRGGAGLIYGKGQTLIEQPAFEVEPVDTTAAGDTFVGYFVAGCVAGLEVEAALRRAAKAAAISVTRPGAIDSIPTAEQVDQRW